MPLGLRSIRANPKVIDTTRVLRGLEKANTAYGQSIQRRMQRYPAQKPTTYVRTGDLGRGWTAPGSLKVTPYEMILVNRVGYSVWVQGPNDKAPGQARVMKGKGWQSLSTVAREERRKWVGIVNREIRGRPG